MKGKNAGATKRVTSFADKLKLPFAIIHDDHLDDSKDHKLTLIGDVKDRVAFILVR